MWSMIRVFPRLLKYGWALLEKATVSETRQILRENEKKVRQIDKQHDDDPLSTTTDFFSGDGVRDTNDTE